MSEISRKLMKLACFFDEHPEFDEFPELFERRVAPYFDRHVGINAAAQLDVFTQRFGVEIQHVETNGQRYVCVDATVDGHTFHLQCFTEDYEAATGKTVDSAVTS